MPYPEEQDSEVEARLRAAQVEPFRTLTCANAAGTVAIRIAASPQITADERDELTTELMKALALIARRVFADQIAQAVATAERAA